MGSGFVRDGRILCQKRPKIATYDSGNGPNEQCNGQCDPYGVIYLRCKTLIISVLRPKVVKR